MHLDVIILHKQNKHKIQKYYDELVIMIGFMLNRSSRGRQCSNNEIVVWKLLSTHGNK